MRSLLVLFIVLVAVSSSQAARLSDSDFFEYEVLFTNPICDEYKYTGTVKSEGGEKLFAKPRNVYCKPKDAAASRARDNSPEKRLVQWIRDPATQEIFFAYLSFSNSVVRQAICKAVQERGVKVTFVLDSGTELGEAEALKKCRSADGESPKLVLRGGEGGLGYAHNKLFIINPNWTGKIRLVFSSGNLSSGVVLHHENWNFITTDISSNFAQVHLCLMNGMLEHGNTSTEYSKYIVQCRRAIRAPVETDIQTFFVPGEGDEATRVLDQAIRSSKNISVAAHRFSYGHLVGSLSSKLRADKNSKVRVVTDDDTYWVGTTGEQVGANMANEYHHIQSLVKLGGEAKYLETNHEARLLHHNKFIVFDDKAVFTGAGNLTGDAFDRNFENFYFVTIPQVVASFRKQYEHLWQDLGTSPADMPTKNILP